MATQVKITNRLLESIEFVANVFFNKKIDNLTIDYKEIPVYETHFKNVSYWLKCVEDKEDLEINPDNFLKIDEILNKYFRDNFIKYLDRSEIDEYLRSYSYYHVEAEAVFCEYLDEKTKQFFINASKTTQVYRQGDEYGLFERVTYEHFADSNIKRFIRQVFYKRARYYLAIIHLNSVLGIFRIAKANTSTNEKALNVSEIENTFDHVDINKVYNFFKKELVKTNYLSEADLLYFLSLAFYKNQQTTKKFTFTNDPPKGIITNIFYRYYRDLNAKRSGYRPKCIKLLTDYFNSYEFETVKNNFNK